MQMLQLIVLQSGLSIVVVWGPLVLCPPYLEVALIKNSGLL